MSAEFSAQPNWDLLTSCATFPTDGIGLWTGEAVGRQADGGAGVGVYSLAYGKRCLKVIHSFNKHSPNVTACQASRFPS